MDSPRVRSPLARSPVTVAAIVALSGAVFVADLLSALGIATNVLYVGPVLLSLWLPGPRATLATASACTALTLIGWAASHHDSAHGPFVFQVVANRGISVLAIWSVAAGAVAQKRLSATLRASEERWRRTWDECPDLLVRLTSDGRVRSVNCFGARLLGRTPGELEGAPFATLVLDPDRERLRAEIEAARSADTPDAETRVELDFRLAHRDGGEVRVNSRVLAVPGSEHTEIALACRDVSDRRAFEDELRTTTESLVHEEGLPELGAWTWDLATNTVHWSETARHLLGAASTKSTIPYERAIEVVHPSEREAVERRLREALAGEHPYDLEFRVVRGDGAVRYVRAWARVLRAGGDGRPAGMRGLLLDRTQDVLAMRELESLLAERRRLAVSHHETQESERRHLARELHDELGQTLSAVAMRAEHLLTLAHGRDVEVLATEIAELCRSIATGLRGIVHGLRPPALDHLGLADALRELGEQVATMHPSMAFAFEMPDHPPEVPEPGRVALYRVAQEALTNAVRHADATEVAIRLREVQWGKAGRERAVELVVRDDGDGIEPEDGYGVGIPGMRERIEDMGGTFRLANLPGGGLEVRARVPVPARERAA